jgi:hypothetical protein
MPDFTCGSALSGYWSYWVDDVRAARGVHEDGTPRLRRVISVAHSNVTRGKLLQYPILDN